MINKTDVKIEKVNNDEKVNHHIIVIKDEEEDEKKNDDDGDKKIFQRLILKKIRKNLSLKAKDLTEL